MSVDERPYKRPRLADEPMSDLEYSVLRHSQLNMSSSKMAAPGPISHAFWFEDGDLVLAVQDTIFRIHAARLVNASAEFASLISSPLPLPNGREASARAAEEISAKLRTAGGAGAGFLDGCQFVRLEADAPRDWVVALEAIYDPLSFQVRPVIFDALAGALRISTKYNVPFLREWAITQMRSTWPSNLDQMAPMALSHAADAIALARQCDVPEILPAAFYALSVQRWRSGADGGRAHAVLAPPDLRRLVAGREALQDVLVEIVAAPLVLSQSMLPNYNADRSSSFGGNIFSMQERGRPSAVARPNTTYPPSPAPSPSPKSPIISSAPATASTSPTNTSAATSSRSPSPPPAPRFDFCPSHGPGAAACRGVLDALWRVRLAPDGQRAWGTWLVRELHRLATLPRGALCGRGAQAYHSGAQQAAAFDAYYYGGQTGVGTGALQRYAYEWEGGWAPEGGGGLDEPSVCGRCWEENRRLALWRLDWLCEAIPGMFLGV